MSKNSNLLLNNQLCFALYAATNTITRIYRSKLDKVGITYSQYLVLIVLWETDGLSIKQLAQRLKLDSAMITPLVKRLETMHLVNRKRSHDDERVVHVCLSAKGKRLENRVARIQKEVACKTGLSDTEFYQLRDTLHQLVDTMIDNDSDEAVA